MRGWLAISSDSGNVNNSKKSANHHFFFQHVKLLQSRIERPIAANTRVDCDECPATFCNNCCNCCGRIIRRDFLLNRLKSKSHIPNSWRIQPIKREQHMVDKSEPVSVPSTAGGGKKKTKKLESPLRHTSRTATHWARRNKKTVELMESELIENEAKVKVSKRVLSVL